MSSSLRPAAVDLGATSGRVMVGTVAPGSLGLEEVHRFPNGPVTASDGSLHWDIGRIHREVLTGLRAAGRVDAVGIDSWAVDYGLLDAAGTLLGDPYCYRDGRTDGMAERVRAAMSDELRQRFMREAMAVSKVDHRNVVRVLDFGFTDDGCPFIVMEYLRGQDLGARLRQNGCPLPVELVVDVMLGVCAALVLGDPRDRERQHGDRSRPAQRCNSPRPHESDRGEG